MELLGSLAWMVGKTSTDIPSERFRGFAISVVPYLTGSHATDETERIRCISCAVIAADRNVNWRSDWLFASAKCSTRDQHVSSLKECSTVLQRWTPARGCGTVECEALYNLLKIVIGASRSSVNMMGTWPLTWRQFLGFSIREAQ